MLDGHQWHWVKNTDKLFQFVHTKTLKRYFGRIPIYFILSKPKCQHFGVRPSNFRDRTFNKLAECYKDVRPVDTVPHKSAKFFLL